jgi:hypothetical protein
MVNIPFEELVASSTHSHLLGYEFTDGILTIHLEIDDLDGIYVINIPTNYVYGENISSESPDLRNCRLDLIELSEILDVYGSVYVPNANFEIMMSEVQCGVSLAYGQPCTEAQWLLNAIGHSRLLSCFISDLENVSWYFED